MPIICERRGAGEPLVLIHGIGHRWQAWLPVMDSLARHHEVIAVDLPGFGCSPLPATGMPRTMPGLLDALRDELAALGVDRPHVAGNSLGGGLALELAACGAAASATALSPAGFQSAAERRRALSILAMLRAGCYQPLPMLRGTVTRSWVRDLTFGTLVTHPERLDLDRILGDCLALRAGKGFWATAWGLRAYTFAGEPDVPVTVAWAIRDRILPLAGARRARAALPRARHIGLPGCGHVPMSDNPRLVARVILETTGASSTVD